MAEGSVERDYEAWKEDSLGFSRRLLYPRIADDRDDLLEFFSLR